CRLRTWSPCIMTGHLVVSICRHVSHNQVWPVTAAEKSAQQRLTKTPSSTSVPAPSAAAARLPDALLSVPSPSGVLDKEAVKGQHAIRPGPCCCTRHQPRLPTRHGRGRLAGRSTTKRVLLAPDRGRKRIGQGTRRPPHSRAQPAAQRAIRAGELRGNRRDTARGG